VNIGDCLVAWTGGIVRSNLHRVTFGPGAQANCTRYSIKHLIRPEQNASMKRLLSRSIPTAEEDGEEEIDLTASEWEKKMFLVMMNSSEAIESKGGKDLKEFPAEAPTIVS
jgi:isopenicillin N synthase-like dioxygenase